MPTAVRVSVWERDMGACIRCGGPGQDLHHRQRRRDGDHQIGNCVTVCRTCHSYVHAHPEEARDNGWIVSFAVDDPCGVKVRAWLGWMLLDNDGVAYLVDAPVDG